MSPLLSHMLIFFTLWLFHAGRYPGLMLPLSGRLNWRKRQPSAMSTAVGQQILIANRLHKGAPMHLCFRPSLLHSHLSPAKLP